MKEAHGDYKSAEYGAWTQMRARCMNRRHASYKDYGARGITICRRWRSYTAFLADMGRRPSEEHTLERKDNALGYSKENCVWATRKEQANNRRSNVLIAFRGKLQSLAGWSEELGIPYLRLHQRLGKLGWPVERAFTEPAHDDKSRKRRKARQPGDGD